MLAGSQRIGMARDCLQYDAKGADRRIQEGEAVKQLDFERSEFEDRLRRARAALAEQAVEAMIVHDPANIFWLTGWRGKGYQIHQALIVTVEDKPLGLLTR